MELDSFGRVGSMSTLLVQDELDVNLGHSKYPGDPS